MLEVRDCFKNVSIGRKEIGGLKVYHIINHPMKDVHENVDLIWCDIYDRGGLLIHHYDIEGGEKCPIEADRHCIYTAGLGDDDNFGKVVVRTKYYYDFEIPDTPKNIAQNEPEMAFSLKINDKIDKVYGTLENNDLNGILTTFEGSNLGWVETPYITPTIAFSVDNSDGTYSYSWANDNEWGVSTGPVQPSSLLWSTEDIATLREIIDEHRNN